MTRDEERRLALEAYPRFAPLPGEAKWPHVSRWGEMHWRHWMRQTGAAETEIDRYLAMREQYGVSIGQGRGHPLKWIYRPTPKQLRAHLVQEPNLLYGGAYGGAKSHWLRWDFHKRALYIPNYTWLILRRTFPELERTHMREAIKEQGLLGCKLVDTEFRYPNGSLGEFGHCQDLNALERWLSSEYDCIGIDEAATFPREWVLEILSRARTSKEGITAVTRLTSNPQGAHTRYLVDRYIDKTVEFDEDPFYEPAEFGYVPARLFDNPWLMDRDGSFTSSIRKLSGLQPERRKQLLDGNWDALTGQYFPELSRDSHQVQWEVSPDLSWERWIDWGYNTPGVCYWVACLPDGRLYLRGEWKFQGTLASDVADGIKERTTALGHLAGGPLRVRKTVVDPSMFNKTGHWGESMAETFARRGVPCTRGDNQREMGWQRLRHWFKTAPDGMPWLVTHPSCAYFWRTMPSLVASKTNPEDLDTEGEDHCGDACRYGVMARPSPTRVLATTRSPLTGTAGELLAQLYAGLAPPTLGADAVRGRL